MTQNFINACSVVFFFKDILWGEKTTTTTTNIQVMKINRTKHTTLRGGCYNTTGVNDTQTRFDIHHTWGIKTYFQGPKCFSRSDDATAALTLVSPPRLLVVSVPYSHSLPRSNKRFLWHIVNSSYQLTQSPWFSATIDCPR